MLLHHRCVAMNDDVVVMVVMVVMVMVGIGEQEVTEAVREAARGYVSTHTCVRTKTHKHKTYAQHTHNLFAIDWMTLIAIDVIG